MLIYEGNLHKKIGAISQLGAEKITFPPKPDGHTDIQTYILTDRRTDRYLLLLSSFATKNDIYMSRLQSLYQLDKGDINLNPFLFKIETFKIRISTSVCPYYYFFCSCNISIT